MIRVPQRLPRGTRSRPTRNAYAKRSDGVVQGRLAGNAPQGVARAATIHDENNVQLELYGNLEVALGYLKHFYDASDVLVSSLDSFT